MPYVRKRVIVEALVWEPFARPEWPGLPGGRPPGWGIPEFPEGPWEPGRPEFPWVPDEPGIGGGPVLPGRPSLPPDFEWPGLPERPDRPPFPVYPVVDPDDIGGHPNAEELDLNATARVAVSDGSNIFPAYVVTGGESEDPRHPERGLPGAWVTVAYHGHVAWAWSPTVTVPERPERPAGGLPGRPPQRPSPER